VAAILYALTALRPGRGEVAEGGVGEG
jgi:hypothetical protein